MSATYEGPPPPASALGAWLLRQVQELVDSVRSLVATHAEDKEKLAHLIETVNGLKESVERSTKIQESQGIELAEITIKMHQTKKELNGVKISRGKHKANAQKLVAQMEERLH